MATCSTSTLRLRVAQVRAAAASMARRHGGLGPALGKWFKQWWASHKRVLAITWIVLKVRALGEGAAPVSGCFIRAV